MNYTTLFPNLIKISPEIKSSDLCYNYQKSNNYNKNLNIYLPQGKKLVLWFLKYDNKPYSILMEINEQNNKIEKCYFQYTCFKEELTNGCGTLLWCTKIENELSLNKIIYYMGEKYKKKLILENLNDIKYMLDNYTKNINNSEFIQFKIPIISSNKNFINEASCLNYNVYSIISQNNYIIPFHNYMCNFSVSVIDHLKDIYSLSCINNDELEIYCNAFINDFKTSRFLKDVFKIKNKDYTEIEFSDNDSDDCSQDIIYDDKIITCIFIPDLKKWKPYKTSYKKYIDNYKKIKYIENKKY